MRVDSRVGPYTIVGQLGAGGMGVVYRARDERLDRDVAIKVLPLGVIDDDISRARFRREALALAKLSHPNIATLFDVGEQDGISYIVMECVAGEALSSRIARGPLAVRDVVALGIEIAGALEDAHEHGIVHRDLKPANIMVTPRGRAKVLDFGLAKLFGAVDPSTKSVTETRGAVGTLLYMSPEQSMGEAVDNRTDLWSLGVLLHEALTGAPPFTGGGTLGILNAITLSDPPSIRAARSDVPPELEQIVRRLLSKDVGSRYQSASEVARDLTEVASRLSGTTAQPAAPRAPLRWFAAGAAVIIGVLMLSGWAITRTQRRQWARVQAPAEIAKLQSQDMTLAAYDVLEKAAAILPADSTLGTIRARMMDTIGSITSSPPGASVEIEDYLTTDTTAWRTLGVTPLSRLALPHGYYRWRISDAKLGAIVVAPELRPNMHFALDSATAAPAGMVYAPGRTWGDFISFVGWVGPLTLPPFDIDRYEVTNAEYQRFVDAGGYSRPEYWTDPFLDGSRVLARDAAMQRLRDTTGRPGPSTWKGGHFPDGQANYPVSGVSWYEASAYARWAGKALPAMAQWYYAAPPFVAGMTVRASNISRDKLAPVGSFRGLGAFGTYDMAGNVREWVANPVDGDRRLILGGSWSSLTYLYSEPEAASAFDRSAANGFRTVRNLAPAPPAMLAAIRPLERDFSKYKPASNEVFDAYRLMYAYDRRDLDAHADGVVKETSEWREERVTFRTAYGSERMAAYIFLPKHVKPPYQTVLFFPSARVLDLTDSRSLGDVSFFDYVVESGRAVVYPIYQNTYERRLSAARPGASQVITLTVQRYQDLARTLDYLATRSDIDTSRVAYLGVSMGSAEGVIYTTLLQDRLKTDVFLDGGFFLDKPTPGRDQADFAPRLRIPVLMVNGRYDYSFSLERAQNPLFQMLGTPAADKRHVILETPHDVRAKRPELIDAVLPWLDRYLGPVR